MDDSNSDISAPSTLSSVSGFSSDASSFLYGGGYAHAPNVRPVPLSSETTLRPNFMSGSTEENGPTGVPRTRPMRVSESDVNESPDAAFRHFRTPVTDLGVPFSTTKVVTALPFYGRVSQCSMIGIMVAILGGTILGGFLKHWKLDTTIAQWIMTPGNLFVRALQCVVVPMMFVNLVVATANMTDRHLNKRQSGCIIFIVLVSTALAIVLGQTTAVIMHSVFRSYQKEKATKNTDAIFGIQCGNGKYLEASDDGVVTCSAMEISDTSKFAMDDINNALARNEARTGTKTTLSDNVLSIFNQIVPANIMTAFVSNSLLSIVAFSLPLGVTLVRSFHGPSNLNPLLEFFREVNETLVHMVHHILRFTPFAVLSLLVGSLATSLEDSVAEHPLMLVMLVVAALAVTVLVHMFVVVPVVFVLITRQNPFRFMLQMLPAYVYSLGCSSSMATMPMSLQCIEMSRKVSSPIMHFVLSVGTSLHMPGTAIYLAVLAHFMADVAGISHAQSVSTMLMAFLGAFLCTAMAPPIPTGALTVLTAVWNIVFPEYAIPDSLYALVVASDVFLDRFVTLCNVNAQAMLCHILADHIVAKDVGNVPRAQVQQDSGAR
ncbi:hypothetical protein KXD40_005247 [Peronospora effusa]|uniref:Amino acid transporter n=1 Tax=Peronospora effusa TaxID=542832 RepID=A0A3M6VSH3_9STRA|nr:hypothetical protein DD238_003523 [Peronospora effusa]RQM18828.1 hypothetical protein DD237_002619 [Peronospora effusa]UIZ22526.1 hypothetical protein KXD40_005247 [Peronospora effusa]CAI5702391.1 unnamed protein product [Peronospora effusa]